MSRTKAPREPRKTQDFLPGLAPKKNKAVHDAAIRYADARDARMEEMRNEVAAKESLLEKMAQEGLTEYVYGDVRVNVDSKKTLKVKIAGRSDEAEGEDDGGVDE